MLYPSKSAPDVIAVLRTGPAPARRPLPVQAEARDDGLPEPLLPAPDTGTGGRTAVPVRLRNAIWDRAQGEFGGPATVCVEAELPPELAHLTRVEFECWPDVEGGRENHLLRAQGHLRDGRAAAAFTLARPRCPRTGNPVATCGFLFRARHSRSRPLAGPRLPAFPAADEDFQGAILYSPARGDYLICDTEAEFRSLAEEAGRMRELREKSRRAWERTEPSERRRALEAVSLEAEIFLGNAGKAQPGLEELLLVRGNRRWGRLDAWNYIAAQDRSEGKAAVAGHYRRLAPGRVQRKLDQILKTGKHAGDKSPLLTGKIAVHLFSAPPRENAAWAWRKPDADGRRASDTTPDDAKAQQAFRYTAEAAALRYMAGWDGAEIGFDPGNRKLRFGASGEATGSLFEGKAALKLELPDARGLNLVGWLKGVKYRATFLIDPKRRCLVKACLEGSLSAFVGASVQSALTLNLDRIPRDEANATASAFIGAQGRAMGQATVLWSAGPTPFEKLGSMALQGGVSAGAGAEGRLKIEYESRRFRFEMSAAAALGLGMKGGIYFEADAAEGWKLIGHLLDCVDFHFVAEISGRAYAAYRNCAFAALIADARLAQAEVDWAREQKEGFRTRLARLGAGIRRIKERLATAAGQRSLLRKAAPEALGQAIRTIMRVREADDSSLILFFLNATVRAGKNADGSRDAPHPSPDHKLKWTLRYVSDLRIPEAEGPARERMKALALKDGAARIRAYAMERDAEAADRPPQGGGSFLARFQRLLADSGAGNAC